MGLDESDFGELGFDESGFGESGFGESGFSELGFGESRRHQTPLCQQPFRTTFGAQHAMVAELETYHN